MPEICGLMADTPHSVCDAAGRRWPVVDGIPFLRAGRDHLARDVLSCLDAGDAETALVLLLVDQDDWWHGPTAEPNSLHELVRNHDRLTLRETMALLAWGPVADYFTHRWSDPTFLAGLALTEAHWNAPRSAFELACGIGHHLRELSRRGVAVSGTDVVFAKLWIARHFVVPEAKLVCMDAAQAWPNLGRFDLVVCHDAFYFLEPKADILARLRLLLDRESGILVISHVHNREWENLSAGSAITSAEMASLFPDGVFYDDAELTQALMAGTVPQAVAAGTLVDAEAFAIAAGPGVAASQAVCGLLALPPAGAALRRNPIYDADGRVAWPSQRYAQEYGPRATYPARTDAPLRAVLHDNCIEQVRRRELLDLPERW